MAKCQECGTRRTRSGDRICDGCASKGLNVTLLRLYGKALRQMPGSPLQRATDEKIKARMAELSAQTHIDDN